MLDSLFDARKSGLPVVTLLFFSGCLIVSVPTFFFPGLYQIFGGYKPINYLWQKVTIAFEHGFYGFPLLVHLLGNGILLWFCGNFCEKLLGSARFFLLTIAAIAGFGLAHSLPFIDGHGSSGVIWAYPPVMFVTLRQYRRLAPQKTQSDPGVQHIRGLLIIMWVVITLFMTVLPYFAGWQGDPLTSLILANTFHISATGVGFLFAFLWRGHIVSRLQEMNADNFSQYPRTKLDKSAILVGVLIPLTLTILLLLVALGIIPYSS